METGDLNIIDASLPNIEILYIYVGINCSQDGDRVQLRRPATFRFHGEP